MSLSLEDSPRVNTDNVFVEINDNIIRKKVKILCIDGGGLRGLSCLPILQKLEHTLGGKLADHFDLIIGTSTGSVISASLLAGFSYEKIYDMYEHLRSYLYYHKNSYTTIFRGAYNLLTKGSALIVDDVEHLINNYFGNLTLNDLSKNGNIGFVTTLIDSVPYSPFVLRNYNVDKNMALKYGLNGFTKGDMLVKDAMLRSCNIPYLFNISRVDGYTLVDGGLLCNNPSLIALSEARLIWPNCEIDTLISIGCGKHEKKYDIPKGIIDWSLAFIRSSILSDVPHIHSGILLGSDHYFRLDLDGYNGTSILETNKEVLTQMVDSVNMWIRYNQPLFDKIKEKMNKHK